MYQENVRQPLSDPHFVEFCQEIRDFVQQKGFVANPPKVRQEFDEMNGESNLPLLTAWLKAIKPYDELSIPLKFVIRTGSAPSSRTASYAQLPLTNVKTSSNLMKEVTQAEELEEETEEDVDGDNQEEEGEEEEEEEEEAEQEDDKPVSRPQEVAPPSQPNGHLEETSLIKDCSFTESAQIKSFSYGSWRCIIFIPRFYPANPSSSFSLPLLFSSFPSSGPATLGQSHKRQSKSKSQTAAHEGSLFSAAAKPQHPQQQIKEQVQKGGFANQKNHQQPQPSRASIRQNIPKLNLNNRSQQGQQGKVHK